MYNRDLITYSEIHDYQQCPQLWTWAWKRRLGPRQKPSYLVAGTLIHQVLQRYWMVAADQRDPATLRRLLEQVAVETMVEAPPSALKLLLDYGETFGQDRDLRVVDSERWLDDGMYGGFVDAVVEIEPHGPALLEIKTGRPSIRQLSTLDAQSLLYLHLARANSLPVAGIWFQLLGHDGCRRVYVYHSDSEIAVIAGILTAPRREIWNGHRQPSRLPDVAAMRLDWQCDRCDYQDLCTALLGGQDVETLVAANYVYRPTRAERLSAREGGHGLPTDSGN